MKKAVSTVLILALCLTLFSAGALAAEADAAVSVTRTDIQADSVFNTEGYGSLTRTDSTWQTAPQYALIDENGSYVFSFGQFPCKYYLYDGLFVNGIVTEQGQGWSSGVYSLFDLSGRQVIDKTYSYLDFYNGYGVAITRTAIPGDMYQYEDTRELIDAAGNVVLTLPDGFDLVTGAGGGNFEFELRTWGLSYFGNIGGYGEGLLWVFTASGIRSSIFEAQGLTESSQVFRDNANQMACYGGPYCGYIDLQGKVVIPVQYYSASAFSEGLAAVQEYAPPSTPIEDLPYGADLGGAWKYIDTSGKTAFSGSYATASSFANGYAYVSNDAGKYGYIDTAGRTVLPMEYDGAFGGENGLFTVGKRVNGQLRYGIVDGEGRVVVPLEYDDMSNLDEGVAYGIRDGVVYVIRAVYDEPSPWAEEEVRAAIDAGLVPEDLQDNYVGEVSRGEVAEMFIRLIEKSAGKDIDAVMAEKGVEIDPDAFKDTTDENVLAANALGIINGVGDDLFDPAGTLTRAQIAAILNRVAVVMGVDTAGYTHSFTDVSGHWVDSELGWPVHAGIILGIGDDLFDPEGLLTTEQAIVITHRALEALA